MSEAHGQQSQWHDPSCSSVDVIQTPTFVTCLSCGSSGPPPPPALYLPLPDDSSVRLLWLLSGKLNDPIHCNLRVESLSSKPRFSAISYTWADDNGDDTKCEEIILDGQAFKVSRNCHAALKRARQATTTDFVWIDAICIDQNSTEERGHQVQLMSQIYLQAQKVFAYIGEHHSGSRDVLDTIGQISLSQDPEQTMILSGADIQSAWHSLLSRRYFSRLWIIQELILAKHAVVLCGESSLAWDNFIKYSRLMNQLYNMEENSIFMFDRSVYLDPNKELLLLDFGRQAHATDPRDKIYGLLGLLPAKRLGSVIADYTMSVEQLYVQVALEIARLYGWKAVLDRAGTARRHISCLPSWVPDWSFIDESETSLPSWVQERSFQVESQINGPSTRSLQCCVSDRNHIGLKLAKHPVDDNKWLLLDESVHPLNEYMFFGHNNAFNKHILSEPPQIFWVHTTVQCLYLSLSTPPSFNRMARSLCTLMVAEYKQTKYMRIIAVVRALPLTMGQLRICAADVCTLHLQESTVTEAATSHSPVLDSLLEEYSLLDESGPVEDWVIEAEELWVKRYRQIQSTSSIKENDELYATNDAFWRLLVRRFALREQVVHIA